MEYWGSGCYSTADRALVGRWLDSEVGEEMIEVMLLSCTAGIGACGAGDPPVQVTPDIAAEPPRITVFHNAVVHTLDADGSTHEAIAVRDGAIIAVGTNRQALKAAVAAGGGQQPEMTDLDGRTVLPGFHDSHTHILEASSPLVNCALSFTGGPQAQTFRLRACANRPSVTGWVAGFGWDFTTFIESGQNPLAAIDSAIDSMPAVMLEATSHATWVNSVALALLGIDEDTPDPEGGIIGRDSNGAPNGLLIDNAGDLAWEVALARTPQVDEQTYEGLLFGLARLARNGITSIADARVYWTRGYHEAYLRAEQEKLLTARVVMGLWAYPQLEDETQLATLTGLYSNDPNRLVRASQVKVYSDGITQNTTARTLDPYIIDYGFDTPFGLNYFSEDRLTTYIETLEKVGFDFHIHAIGAGGVNEALNAIERSGLSNPGLGDRRHRLTHVESVDPDDLPRFAALDVIADVQLAGAFTAPDAIEAEQQLFLGADIDALALPVRSLVDAGAMLTLSSDFDVSSMNPFVGIHNAVNRSRESLSLDEALRAYTINAAYLMRQEDRTGSLELGKRADFIVVDQDPYTVNPAQLRNIRVLLTVFDGAEVYRSNDF
ncbi:MAG: amidohydrolase [Pseudomonadota bacterium]